MESFSAFSTAGVIGLALAVCFVVANTKSLPFAHSFRLLPSLYRLLHPRLFPARKTQTPSEFNTIPTSKPDVVVAQPALFKHHVSSSRAVLLDLDINMHKSNSTFFADADINRAELLTRLLSRGLATAGSAPTELDPRRTTAVMPLLAAVQCTFKREIGPFQAYDLSSRILAWDDKSLFLVTYFLRPNTRLHPDLELTGGPVAVLGESSLRRCVYATMVTRYVCKAGRETVLPKIVLEAAGLLVSAPHEADKKGDGAFLTADQVDEGVESGMRYVRGCML